MIRMKYRASQYIIISALAAGFLCAPEMLFAKQLTVPFTAQSPYGNWVQPWQDLCEEASIVMVDQFYQNKSMDKKRAKELLLDIFQIKNNTYGKSLDESAQKMTDLINNFFFFEAYIVENPTIEQIKEQVDLGRPVIIPASGKDLHNPRFRQGGPRYHVLVISGYDDAAQTFITQEPGTSSGLDFRYPYGTIMDAIHDLTPGDIRTGAKRVIFTSPTIGASGTTDGDKDGLTKEEELRHGTSLSKKDSDADGYSDGQEALSGYSPVVNEAKLPNNSLIKSVKNSEVFLLAKKLKHPIVNEAAFIKKGFLWKNVKIVSEKFINSLSSGSPIQ